MIKIHDRLARRGVEDRTLRRNASSAIEPWLPEHIKNTRYRNQPWQRTELAPESLGILFHLGKARDRLRQAIEIAMISVDSAGMFSAQADQLSLPTGTWPRHHLLRQPVPQ